MNSVKNLFVVVMLMGVSYGAIQVINTPDPILEKEAANVEGIDIQIGERNHDSLDDETMMGGNNFASGADAPKQVDTGTPNYPPLPPNTERSRLSTQANSSPPRSPSIVAEKIELKVPDIDMPSLSAPNTLPPSASRTPGAFAQSSQAQPTIDDTLELDVPPLAAPPNNNNTQPDMGSFPPSTGNSFAGAQTQPPTTTAPPSNTATTSDSGAFNGGGSFTLNEKTPETRMEPVSPKPNTTAPATLANSGNQFIDSTNQLVDNVNNFNQNVRDNVGQKVGQFNQQVQQATQPTRDAIGQTFNSATGDAAKMLEQSKAGILDRVNEFANSAEEVKDTVANVVADSVAPVKDSVSQFAAAYLPSADASPTIDWTSINQMANGGQTRTALSTLSKHYSAKLAEDQRLQMLEWLDVLAGKVIYSTEHHLQATPYIVKQNDTLETLAQQWQVPSRLIYMINNEKITDPAMLLPGTELKVVQGPFNAMLSTDRQELTIFLSDMYAGRFPIEMGTDSDGVTHGTFAVREKAAGKTYSGGGQTFAAGATDNPYGKYWLGLENGFGIHEFNSANFPANDRRGSIRVSSQDAADIYGILSNGSQVTITR